MNLLLFISVLFVSFIIVRIVAVAFEITGIEWSIAKFQALSCFSGTGFTTRESELIISNPQRRRIASVLIVLGSAGLVTMIATFANTIRGNPLIQEFKLPFIPLEISSGWLPWVNIGFIIVTIAVIYTLFTVTKISKKFTEIMRSQILKKGIIKPVTFEELMVATGGYGISQIEVCEGSPLLGKTLLDSHLREYDISVLAMERDGETIPNPPPQTKFERGNKIICFGKLENIRKKLCSPASS